MKSELSFLIELLLKQETPAVIKELLAERIKEVEESLRERANVPRGTPQFPPPRFAPPATGDQAPSAQAMIARHPDVPVVVTPVTPAAAEALNRRAQVLASGMSERPEPGRTGPRKF